MIVVEQKKRQRIPVRSGNTEKKDPNKEEMKKGENAASESNADTRQQKQSETLAKTARMPLNFSVAEIINDILCLNGPEIKQALTSSAMAIPVIGDVKSIAHFLMTEEKTVSVKNRRMMDLIVRIEQIKESCSANPGKAATGAKKVRNLVEADHTLNRGKWVGKLVTMYGKASFDVPAEFAEEAGIPRYTEREQLPADWHTPMVIPEAKPQSISPNEDVNKAWGVFLKNLRAPFYYIEIIKKKKIFIRLGHDVTKAGGFTGAYHKELPERTVSDEIGLSLAKELYKMGYDIYVYRSADRTFGGKNVAAQAANAGIKAANEWGADYFISCHANSLDAKLVDVEKYYGTEILYNAATTNVVHARKILDTIMESLSLHREAKIEKIASEKGVQVDAYKKKLIKVERARPGSVNEMRKTVMPAVLLEPVFISNSIDRTAYKDCSGEQIGIALAKCVDSFF